ncbi:MAG: HipA domain-containing protein [Woeseia sp.]
MIRQLSLVRWALFQYLIGNADAHGKNVSFFCRPDGLALAPFYDLVSVVQYNSPDHELAMAYGDEFLLEEGPLRVGRFRAAHRHTPRFARTRDAPHG